MERLALYALLYTVITPCVLGLGTVLIDGDLFIELIGAVYRGEHENGTCYDIDSESLQNIEAVRWVLEELNKKNYFAFLGNKGLGLRVSSTCSSKTRLDQLAYNLTVELEDSASDIVGVIGPDYSSGAKRVSRLLSALPDKYRLLQLGYAPTSDELSNRDIYNNFFRTIPPDSIQTQVMIQFAQALNWTYTAIIYDNDLYGRGGKDALLQAVARDVCFPILIPVETTAYNVQYLQNEIQNKMLNASVPISGAIVFGSYSLASTVLTATENIRAKFPNSPIPNFIFSEAAGYLEGQAINSSKGIFVLSPPRKIIQEFQAQWKRIFTSVTNIYDLPPFYRDWMMDAYKEHLDCTLPALEANNNCPPVSDAKVQDAIPPSVYNQYAIQTLLIMAKTTKTVIEKICGASISLCNEYYSLNRQEFINTTNTITVDFDNDFSGVRIDEFKNPYLTVTFNSLTDATIPDEFPLYEIYNHQQCTPEKTCLKKVAELTSTQMNVQTTEIKDYDSSGNEYSWPNIRIAQCPDNFTCSACVKQSTTDTSLFYEAGDLYIVGIAPIHNPGATPLQCGDIKLGALDVAEVIRFAVKDAKSSYPDRIPQGKIGIIIIDSCNDPHIIQEKVLTLHRLGVLQDGSYIPVADKIIGYIGGWSSGVSSVVADITSRLGFVQISYGSTAPSLSDNQLYPYFLRIPTPDNFQAETMLKIVERFNSNLIQIVYSDTTYGRGGRDTLLSLVAHYGICVAKVHSVTRNTDPLQLISSLRQYSDAKLVVMFLGSFEVEVIIQPFSDNLKLFEFTFISSEGWGTRLSGLSYRNLVGTITLTAELPLNEKFKDHLKDLAPDGSNTDPWIRPYMEKYFQCYYQWSYNKESAIPCTGNERIDVFNTDYKIDAWAPFAERAVLALLQGAKRALDIQCSSSTEICEAFKNNTQILFDETKVLEFDDESGTITSRAFDDNGDGRAGYRIYAISDQGRYIPVGSSLFQTAVSEITFQSSSYPGPSSMNSSCRSQSFCEVCFPTPPVGEKEDSLSLGLIMVIVVLAVICCVLAGMLLFVCNRLGCCLKMENGRPKLSENYITPVYLQRQANGMVHEPEIQGNYDSIGYPYLQKPSGGSMDSRQLPGPPGDSGMGGSAAGSSGDKMSGGSYISSKNSFTSGGTRSNTSQGSNVRTPQQLPENGSEGNVTINKSGVVYQHDGSYITAADHINHAFQPDPEDANVSDQGMRQLSTGSDSSLGYLRSVQTVNN